MYESDNALFLGTMSYVCKFCCVGKWKEESNGMCCASGKVRLPALQPPPEPLRTYLTGEPDDSKSFLTNIIRCYNSAFQMTSFGGKMCAETGYMPTFKVKGQVYHRIGLLLPSENESSKFMQLYFMGDSNAETEARVSNLSL